MYCLSLRRKSWWVQEMCIKKLFRSESNTQKWGLVFSKSEIDENVDFAFFSSLLMVVQGKKMSLIPVWVPRKVTHNKTSTFQTSKVIPSTLSHFPFCSTPREGRCQLRKTSQFQNSIQTHLSQGELWFYQEGRKWMREKIVFMSDFMYVSMHVCLYTYTYAYIYPYTTLIYVCMNTCMCACMYFV